MTEHPIIMSGPMVRAILDGRKTMSRRVIKNAVWGQGKLPFTEWAYAVYPAAETGWIAWFGVRGMTAERTKQMYKEGFPCPHGIPGDLLWCRETWSYITLVQNERQPGDKWNPQLNMPVRMLYRADAEVEGWQIPARWSPSIFMPRWASRLTLRVESVRVERLQDITEGDAHAEGFASRAKFLVYWDVLNAKQGHPASNNDWLWVIGFARVD